MEVYFFGWCCFKIAVAVFESSKISFNSQTKLDEVRDRKPMISVKDMTEFCNRTNRDLKLKNRMLDG